VTARPVEQMAVRLPLEPGPPIDPFALAGQEGMVFCADGQVRVGLGIALSVDLPGGLASPGDVSRAAELLVAVPIEDHLERSDDRVGPGSAVVAFGALPFDRGAPATLVVPELLYGADRDGSEWVTLLTDDPSRFPKTGDALRSWLVDRSTAAPLEDLPGEAAPGPWITPRSSDDAFKAMVATALRSIERGELAKVVLARQVDVTMSGTIAIADLLRRWYRLEPNCAVFSLPTPEGQFVGASPELLVERTGHNVRSRPLAGTTERHPDIGADHRPAELLRSRKDGNEHRLVVEAIEQVLAPLCTELDVPTRPDLVHLHTITHLGTSVIGTLASAPDRTVPGALQLVAALHPTPAVGGVPAATADRLITELEPESRGQYAGPVGVVDAEGNGTWMVGIRAMSVSGAEARLVAGVGIVAGSDPEDELAETKLKLTAVFDALAPGEAFSTGENAGGGHSDPDRAGSDRADEPSRAVS
jgi:menaquinone-specific isochorismate synthase